MHKVKNKFFVVFIGFSLLLAVAFLTVRLYATNQNERSIVMKDISNTFKSPLSKKIYFVGSDAQFSDIQSSINFAKEQGGGTIYIEPNDYYENLTLYSGITLEGCGVADLKFVRIFGQHIIPPSGELGFNHLLFANKNSAFVPQVADGNPNLLFRSCFFDIEDGYLLDIPFLKGSLIFFDCCSVGKNNGFINNKYGNCEPTIFNITIDGGERKNAMYINSKALLFNLHIKQKMEFTGKDCLVTINGGSWLEDTVSIRNGVELKVSCSNIETKNDPAFFVDEKSFLTFDSGSIESSAEEVIQGSGKVRIGNISFPLNSKIAKSITLLQANEYYKTTEKVGSFGDADPLPKQPAGYLITNVNGEEFLVPYYKKQ